MTKNSFKSRLRLALLTATPVFVVAGIAVNASPAKSPAKAKSATKAPTRLAAIPKRGTVSRTNTAKTAIPRQRFLTMAQVKQWQRERNAKKSIVAPALQPYWEGHALKAPMRDLLGGPSPDFGAMVQTPGGAWKKADRKLFAQVFPRPVAPASPSSFRRTPVVPRWVRYPLEFQLVGIGIGTKAVDKDRFNRIDRYGLFAIHGNPTAVVRAIPNATAGGVGGAGGAAGGAAAGAPPTGALGGAPGAAAAPAAPANANLTLQQTPPEVASLFPDTQQGGLPDWALAVTVQLDDNHVEWLYKRDTYSMGFVVDKLGFVDAIIVAGISSPIAQTQLEDPVHTVQLGDDLRKVLFRYGYPDDIVPLAGDPAATANSATGAPGGAAGGGGGAAGGGAGGATNAAYRTYDLRYEQSYNVVFTIRNNRVVRIYIFGDPDFFNAQRRQLLRTRY